MPEKALLRPAVFLDRDGTISEEMGYLNHIARLKIFPYAAEAIRQLNMVGIPVVVITNQSGVSRGIFPESLVHDVHKKMVAELAADGAWIDANYFCPHKKDDGCDCRKPLTGLLTRAAREQHLDLGNSWVVGDRCADVELAHRAGSRGILVKTGYGLGEYELHATKWPKPPDAVADNLADAVRFLMTRMSATRLVNE
jgi:D-glycero-D-manno-heptose 1,7-bisphosphate phosphatase